MGVDAEPLRSLEAIGLAAKWFNAAEVQWLVDHVRWDLEEDLARLFGDAPAHAMGEVLRYDVRHATNMRTTIDESTQQALTQSDSVKSWRVTDVLPSGEMEFVHVVEWVKMSNEKSSPGWESEPYRSGSQSLMPWLAGARPSIATRWVVAATNT